MFVFCFDVRTDNYVYIFDRHVCGGEYRFIEFARFYKKKSASIIKMINQGAKCPAEISDILNTCNVIRMRK